MNAERMPGLFLMPETPWDALGPILREQVLVEGQSFVISRPDESDRLLDHPFVRSAFAEDDLIESPIMDVLEFRLGTVFEGFYIDIREKESMGDDEGRVIAWRGPTLFGRLQRGRGCASLATTAMRRRVRLPSTVGRGSSLLATSPRTGRYGRTPKSPPLPPPRLD